jgi:UDP-N-acetylmuramate dehydrogenase
MMFRKRRATRRMLAGLRHFRYSLHMTSLHGSAQALATKLKETPGFSGIIVFDEPLAPHTTMQVGGTAPLFLVPGDTAALAACLGVLQSSKIPWFILGGGSNVVFPDGSFDRVVVSMEALDTIEPLRAGDTQDSRIIRCAAGVKTDTLVKYCLEHRLGGLETFSGLPGTVGGAACMNARCYDREVSDILAGAEYLSLEDGQVSGALEIRRYIMRKTHWEYKKSPFQDGHRVIVSADFALRELPEAEWEQSAEQAAFCLADRKQKGHFDYPSAGSVFKNNRDFGKPSGMLIDQAGLRGCRIGGAQVSGRHGNFIINAGNATGSDVRALAAHVADEVRRQFGLELEPEIVLP